VQDQPKLKAGVGPRHSDFVRFANAYGLIEFLMVITVKDRPDLVFLLKRIFSFLSDMVTRLVGDRAGFPDTPLISTRTAPYNSFLTAEK